MKTIPLLVFVSSSLLCLCSSLFADDFYVDAQAGDDSASGVEAKPFRTIQRALREVDGPGGTIHLVPGMTYAESITIRKGGTEANPLVLDGHGAVINLGKDVTAGPWTSVGEEYRLDMPVPKFTRDYVTSPIFVNGLPIWAEHPKGRGKPSWHGGSLRYDEDGQIIVRFPDGLTPENSTVVLTSEDSKPAIHASGGQHVIIKDVTAAFAGNDGFNFHNLCLDYKLINIRALFNGDQGISSHEGCEVVVEASEVGFNGSASAGVVDINDAVTDYVDVLCHQNRNAGFLLKGSNHTLNGVVSYGNQGDDLPKPSETITLIDCTAGKESLPQNFPDWGDVETLSNREQRFQDLLPKNYSD